MVHRRLRAGRPMVHRFLRIGSPDRCAASPPGIVPPCALLPGAALNAPCPGYRFTAVCGPVAPWFTAFCGSVARTDAQHRLRELCHPARCSRGRRLTRLARATGSPPSAGLVARVRRQPQPGFSPALTCCASRPANAPAAGQSPDLQNAPAVISPPRLPRSPR